MDYDDVFDRSEARILIDELIKGDVTITLEQIKEKIIELEKQLSLQLYMIGEYKIHNSKLSSLVEHDCVECDECGNTMFF